MFLVAALAVLSYASMRKESITSDEFAHLPAGFSYLETRDFSLYSHNPPLARVLAALPLYFSDVEFDETAYRSSADHWEFGRSFMYQNADRYHEIFLSARLVIIAIAAIGGMALFFFANRLYGQYPALLALLLYAFNPDVIAHSHLVTTDAAATTFMLMAICGFYAWAESGALPRAVIAGVLLGLAEITKFSAIALYPAVIVFFVYLRAKGREKRPGFKGLAIVFAVSIVVINAGYLFGGVFTPIGSFGFESEFMRAVKSALPAWTPLPLPYDYIAGFDMQKAEADGGYWQFLMGETSAEGWRHYYPLAFALKEPLSLLALIALALALRGAGMLPKSRGAVLLLITMAVYLAAFALGTNINIGLRYMLPLFPLIFVLVSATAAVNRGRAFVPPFVACLAALYVAASGVSYPRYLSFFNYAASTPDGREHLADSNLDWGQDLVRLREYMDERGVDEIKLAYFGPVDPKVYGVKFSLLGSALMPGERAVVSKNLYHGMPYDLVKDGFLYARDENYYAYLRDYEIVDRVGDGMLVIMAK
jgi:4-amino-4-deoxy-L-arabinose transferase-like glycosyltransferase